MKKYVVLFLNNNSITFDYRVISSDEKTHVNDNNLYNHCLFYSYKYFSNHYEKVFDLLKKKGNFSLLEIKCLIKFRYATILIIRLKISHLILNFYSTIALEDYELLLSTNTLTHIDCFYMPDFIIKKFENKKIKVKVHNKYKISDRFMLQEDAFDYETLYYMKNLIIKEDYPTMAKDIEEFLRINYNLKSVHIYVFSKELITTIIDLVKNDESRNIVVFLHQSADKGNFITENFSWLKQLNKKCKIDYTCEFRIVYSKSFVLNNLFKQLTFNNLKLIFILFTYLSLVSLIIVKSYAYVEKLSIDKLNLEIMNETLIDEELNDGDVNLEEELSEEEIKSKYTFSKVFSSLKKINKETVGYLSIDNTNISYPVVQHSDNSYYLKRDFYKKKTSMGWIYMDYRNNHNTFDSNTIIYGHSMLNKTMFGTLHNVLNSSWRKKESNMIISYDTPDGSYLFKIFSAYRVDYTTDYLKTSFDSKKSFNKFVSLIKGRSAFKSSEKLEFGDKILTLSTCTGTGNKRLVVHAKYIGKEEK